MDEKIIFYSTHCPRCKVIELKLKRKNIHYEECNNVEEMTQKGITEAPALGVYNAETSQLEILDFNKALKWINLRGN